MSSSPTQVADVETGQKVRLYREVGPGLKGGLSERRGVREENRGKTALNR